MEPVSSGSFKGLVSRSAGLLALRASIAPSVGSREGGMKDCDPTDGTPTACTVAWKSAPERWTARVARYDIVRSVEDSRMGIVGTMSNPARPEERFRPRAVQGERDYDLGARDRLVEGIEAGAGFRRGRSGTR